MASVQTHYAENLQKNLPRIEVHMRAAEDKGSTRADITYHEKSERGESRHLLLAGKKSTLGGALVHAQAFAEHFNVSEIHVKMGGRAHPGMP